MGRSLAAEGAWRGEGGWTLVELLVAMALGLLVIGASVSVFVSTIRSEPKVASRGAAIQQARFTMERITRELRQGASVSGSATQLSIVTYANSASCGPDPACLVTYTCAAGTCTRSVARADGSAPGTAREVVAGLSNSAGVFTYSTDSTCPAALDYVGAELVLPAHEGDDAISLEDGVFLRNLSCPS